MGKKCGLWLLWGICCISMTGCVQQKRFPPAEPRAKSAPSIAKPTSDLSGLLTAKVSDALLEEMRSELQIHDNIEKSLQGESYVQNAYALSFRHTAFIGVRFNPAEEGEEDDDDTEESMTKEQLQAVAQKIREVDPKIRVMHVSTQEDWVKQMKAMTTEWPSGLYPLPELQTWLDLAKEVPALPLTVTPSTPM